MINAITHGIDKSIVLMNDEVNDSWQNQFAEFDAESTNRQEALQVGVCEAFGNAAGNVDDPIGIILVVLDCPQLVFWIHNNAKFCSVHIEGRLPDATAASERSDIIDLQRCTLKDVR